MNTKENGKKEIELDVIEDDRNLKKYQIPFYDLYMKKNKKLQAIKVGNIFPTPLLLYQ